MDDVYPIDFVLTWIDGSDPNHTKLKDEYLQQEKNSRQPIQSINTRTPQSKNIHKTSYESCRWRSSGEINESVKSIFAFAPWVRNVFIVCSLAQEPRLSVPHDTFDKTRQDIIIIQDYEICDTTPTFNSHAIEANLHKIPDLAEHFVYMCDDMFLGSPVSRHYFFSEQEGKPFFFPGQQITVQNNYANARYPAWYTARCNNFRLLQQQYGSKIREDAIHQARAITKSLMEMAWNHRSFGNALKRTSRSRFRAPQDVEPLGLCIWNGIENHLVIKRPLRGGAQEKYYNISDSCKLNDIFLDVVRRKPTLYCLNDTMLVPNKERVQRYVQLLQTQLPHHHQNKVLANK
jgi:hypothetical protein